MSKAEAQAEESSRDAPAEKPPPPPRRQTMEVQMAWLEVRGDEPRVEQIATPATGVPAAQSLTPISDSLKSEPRLPSAEDDEERTRAVQTITMRPKAKSVHPITDALGDDTADMADEFPEKEFPEEEPPTSLRRKPPRLPGAFRSMPAMPVVTSKPPPPPRRHTQEVEMSWVELVDEDVEEVAASEPLPKLYSEEDEAQERKEVTRVESAPASTQRIEAEKAVVALANEAKETAKRPAIEEEKIAAEAAARKERLSQFLQAAGSIPPGALKVSDLQSTPPSDVDHDKAREEALAARKREQDARDREILERRRAERVRERLEQEAKERRRALEREEEERAAAMRTGAQDKALLDLSGIDEEIDNALDGIFGSHLSYPPPPPDEKK